MGMELDVRHPLALARGEGEAITDRDARFVALLVDRPELTMTISRYDEGEEGPPPHLHRQHADCFAILEGSMRYELAGEPRELAAGDLLIVPPMLVHTFRNHTQQSCWWLNLHTPDGGFAAMMRSRRDTLAPTPWDSFDADPSEGLPVSAALHGERAESEWLTLERVAVRTGERLDRIAAGALDAVAVITGGGRFAAGAIEAELDRHAVAAAPAGTAWRFTADEDSTVCVASVPTA
jgi:quercetin dioxygenase-like cupin family protein